MHNGFGLVDFQKMQVVKIYTQFLVTNRKFVKLKYLI